MNESCFDIAIIGGGPAGLSAAVSASKAAISENKQVKICIFEKENSLGKSILKTGNGRCNFSNYYASQNKCKEYNNPKICNSVFKNCETKLNELQIFDEEESESNVPAYKMFEYLGLSCSLEEDGRMYPYTGKAETVVEVFNFAIKDLNINNYLNHELKSVNFDKKEQTYKLNFVNGNSYNAKKIILTVGGIDKSFSLLKNNYTKIRKALGPLETDTKYLKSVDGIRAHVRCSIYNVENSDKNSKKTNNNQKKSENKINRKLIHQEVGEILFRKYGVSGICVFNVSRFLDENKNQELEIDFAPENSIEEIYETLIQRYEKFFCGKSISAYRLLSGMMLKNLIKSVCDYSKINVNNISTEDIYSLANSIKSFRLKIVGVWDKKICQITQGGIACTDFDNGTMELNNYKNVFVAGEMVDIDGPCGGFNLHWAWTSGILAGISAI